MQNAALTITNPLVLYRALLATNKIRPDPAQLRLALHLQKLYDRLKDYEPTVEYSQRLQKLGQAIGSPNASSSQVEANAPGRSRGIWSSLLASKQQRDSLALMRVLSDHEEALKLSSPQGLMVHGEVGTGKSMLIDLFAECLPTRKKRRWHFNTFMLDAFARLETLRLARLSRGRGGSDDHALLWLARDLVEKSPVLFLDEFQLPDRASAKIMTNLMTGFFSLGGVLVATSNRMPDELAKAAGIEFVQPAPSRSRWRFGGGAMVMQVGGNKMFGGGQSEFAQFLELLKARCEVWEMEGKSDYRRSSEIDKPAEDESVSNAALGQAVAPSVTEAGGPSKNEEAGLPQKYFIHTPAQELEAEIISTTLPSSSTSPIPWKPTTLKVYGRAVPVPRAHAGFTHFTFPEICGTTLGPADYITLASTFHTFIITSVPVLTSLLKNEARRFITLLDALYESKCKLLISADADPDNLFFPELRAKPGEPGDESGDGVYAETFSEMHQDLTSPFRPNVSAYGSDTLPSPSEPEIDMTHSRLAAGMLAEDALEDDPPNKIRRGLGFTDSDFLVGAESLHVKRSPNFADTGAFVGEDEKFAYKRATSRLWEMCGRKWWERGRGSGPEEWWRPLPLEARGWERPASASAAIAGMKSPAVAAAIAELEAKAAMEGEGMGDARDVNEKEDELMFKYGTSPFRDWSKPPVKIPETHAWGIMKWGKKAGAWGQGVEGLKDRKKGGDDK